MCELSSSDCAPGPAIVGRTLAPATRAASGGAILALDGRALFPPAPFSLWLQTVPGPADDEDDDEDEDDDDTGDGGGNIEPDDDEGYGDEDDEDDDEEPWQVRTRR